MGPVFSRIPSQRLAGFQLVAISFIRRIQLSLTLIDSSSTFGSTGNAVNTHMSECCEQRSRFFNSNVSHCNFRFHYKTTAGRMTGTFTSEQEWQFHTLIFIATRSMIKY